LSKTKESGILNQHVTDNGGVRSDGRMDGRTDRSTTQFSKIRKEKTKEIVTMARKDTKEESSVSESEEEKVSGKEIRESESDDDEKNEVTNEQNEEDESRDKKRRKKVHKLSLTATEDFNEELRKRGVVYVARVPPRMNPTKIKALLSDFGTPVTRVYLVEEDAARRKRRRKATGNATKRYMEGWVEFKDKTIAKHVAQSLNNTPISMHKRNVHYGKLL
jgi:ESF2/ABP1 family protein